MSDLTDYQRRVVEPQVAELKARAEEAESRLAMARAALEPFAAFADRLDGRYSAEGKRGLVDPEMVGEEIWCDDEEVDTGVCREGRELLVGDFRRARQLLAEPSDP